MDPQIWEKVSAIFGAAVELEPEKRKAFLDQACEGDPEVRKQVDALLASDQDAANFIDVPVLDPGAPYLDQLRSPSFAAAKSPSSAVPLIDVEFNTRQIIAGRYELISRLGSGGMGEVWRAYDLKLRVDVALKTLRTQAGDLEMLRQEVRSAREVISPNVCRIFDLVVDQEREFISMEYIDGITLIELLKQKGPLELNHALDIANQFLTGLHAVHETGLVHCDLKPENIMITRTGRVLVMDFGIAKHFQETNQIVSGTRPYMSPEQAEARSIDARSDLFSAGVILAEMSDPNGVPNREMREQIWSIAHNDPQQLPDSPWKSAIVRALAQDPRLRFESVPALIRALEKATVSIATAGEKRPYPGLASFSANDAQYFFGRELEVEGVLKKLRELHLLAIAGPSGAGKTSFLRAGLIPSLPANWNSIFCVPGDHPILNLAQALVHQLSVNTEELQNISNIDDPEVVVPLLREWRSKHQEAVLIVDRFEELFTLNSFESQSLFADLLANISIEEDVRVLCCMRDDYLFRCYEHHSLLPLFSDLTPIGALSGPSLRRAFVQPALKCGYRFEDEQLVDEILAHVEKERGALPLMAFAASRIWEKRDRSAGLLTRRAYQSIGGVGGALAGYAEEIMERVGPNEFIVREIFRNLITAENTRAGRDVSELLSIFKENQSVAERVLRTLIDARLLTPFESTQADGKTTSKRVEIVHESLLTHWPRLIRWQMQDAESVQLREQLRSASQLWDQRERVPDLLWTGTSFKQFELWKENYRGGLTSTEQEFASAMVRNAGKQRRRRNGILITTFVLLLAVLAIISQFWRAAAVSRDRAVAEAKRAEASKVLTLGTARTDADSSEKLACALTSLELYDTPEARLFALESISGSPVGQLIQIPKWTRRIALSPDGRFFVASSDRGLQLFSRSGGSPIIIDNEKSDGSPKFTSNGDFIIWRSSKDHRTIQFWSISQKKMIRKFAAEGFSIFSVAGPAVVLITDAAGKFDETQKWTKCTIRIWNSHKNDLQIVNEWNLDATPFVDINGSLNSITFAKGRNVLIRPIHSWKLGNERVIGSHLSEVDRVMFDSGGNQILSSDSKGEIRVWKTDSESTSPTRVIHEALNPESGPWFWPDPDFHFVVAQRPDSLLRWDLSGPSDTEPVIYRHKGEMPLTVVFDQQKLQMIVVWRSAMGFYPMISQHPYVLRESGGAFNVRFTPDGRFVTDGNAIWSTDGNIQREAFWKPGEPEHGWPQALDVDPLGKFVVVGTSAGELYQISLVQKTKESLALRKLFKRRLGADQPYDCVSISPDGRLTAASGIHGPVENLGIEIWNLQTGDSQVIAQGNPIFSMKFISNQTLVSGDVNGNIRLWNIEDGSNKMLMRGKGLVSNITLSKDGRYLLAAILSVKVWDETQMATSDVLLYDFRTGKSHPILSHGNRVYAVAFDPAGKNIITGDIDGLLRVGSIDGQVPHTTFVFESISDVTVDPTGSGIAYTGGAIGLWEIPTGTPLQTLPLKEFIDKMQSLTNVRVISDEKSSNGYDTEFTPLPGWESLSKWQLRQSTGE